MNRKEMMFLLATKQQLILPKIIACQKQKIFLDNYHKKGNNHRIKLDNLLKRLNSCLWSRISNSKFLIINNNRELLNNSHSKDRLSNSKLFISKGLHSSGSHSNKYLINSKSLNSKDQLLTSNNIQEGFNRTKWINHRLGLNKTQIRLSTKTQ